MFAKNDIFVGQLLADESFRIIENGQIEKAIDYRDMEMIRGAVRPVWRAVGYINTSGQKLVHYKERHLLQSRIVWAYFFKDLSPTSAILFKDGNPKNTHPNNLLQKSLSELQYTRYQAGRKAAGSKLSWDQATELRKEWGSGNYTQAKLAEKYEISQNAVSLIVNNKTYINQSIHREDGDV
jgi:hypothetical protein